MKDQVILYERGGHYVQHRIARGKRKPFYEVLRHCGTHAVVDGAFEYTRDGFSQAKAKVDCLYALTFIGRLSSRLSEGQ